MKHEKSYHQEEADLQEVQKCLPMMYGILEIAMVATLT